jgi:hypothetical protein
VAVTDSETTTPVADPATDTPDAPDVPDAPSEPRRARGWWGWPLWAKQGVVLGGVALAALVLWLAGGFEQRSTGNINVGAGETLDVGYMELTPLRAVAQDSKYLEPYTYVTVEALCLSQLDEPLNQYDYRGWLFVGDPVTGSGADSTSLCFGTWTANTYGSCKGEYDLNPLREAIPCQIQGVFEEGLPHDRTVIGLRIWPIKEFEARFENAQETGTTRAGYKAFLVEIPLTWAEPA